MVLDLFQRRYAYSLTVSLGWTNAIACYGSSIFETAGFLSKIDSGTLLHSFLDLYVSGADSN
ncbi:hypothetical protein CK203_084986 [Vitis vinifera]|uniref:Uncharacterized protein n=1 Tax=Vitis vinifera TaxID=29760 RepID=A0A438F052_VITVI|nr:hypothetical protein CK203_084986 [Vitis vinifera]